MEEILDLIINHENQPSADDNGDNEEEISVRNSNDLERDDQRQTIIPNIPPTEVVINHNHRPNEDEESSPIPQHDTINESSSDVTTMTTRTVTKEEEQQTLPEDQTELIEAREQIETLREHLQSTNGRFSPIFSLRSIEQCDEFLF